ncbi:MAG: signal peptidase I [Proteobacteria bacterium]|nr:MAG: signal peptidase I [Pseudomonadota bacterium]
MKQRGLQGTWSQAIATFLLPLWIVFAIRWMIAEPFVIPSGSMIPSLLIHDHIIVKKYSLGIKIPFTDHWLMRWRKPEAGEILVFRFPSNPDVFYIKRLIGLPGDVIEIQGNGRIVVNGKPWTQTPEPIASPDGFKYFTESNGTQSHVVRYFDSTGSLEEKQKITVPEGQYFFMGDNRDQSSDGRVWGTVPEKYLVGPAAIVWLSCETTLTSVSYICDPREIRWKRLFKAVQ